MESYPRDEVVVPEGLANGWSEEGFLKRDKEFNRRWHAEAAEQQGVALETAVAKALSPSQEAIIMHFGYAAKASIEETGEVAPAALDSWILGSDEAHLWFMTLWARDMADFDKDRGWTVNSFGLEVLDALQVLQQSHRTV